MEDPQTHGVHMGGQEGPLPPPPLAGQNSMFMLFYGKFHFFRIYEFILFTQFFFASDRDGGSSKKNFLTFFEKNRIFSGVF